MTAGRFEVRVGGLETASYLAPYSYLHTHDGVCIVALIDNKLIIEEQFRYPIDKAIYEFPGGTIERGEEPKHAAIRELKEETGYTALRLIPLGEIYSSPGSTDECIHLFFAECEEKGQPSPDCSEQISLIKMSADDLEKSIESGRFPSSISLAAYHLAKTNGYI